MTHTPKQTMRQRRLALKRMFLSTTFRFTALLFMLVFGVLYVMQTSSVSTKGYDINELQRQITKLEQDNQRLEFEIATNRSMQSIQQRLSGMDLVAVDTMEYGTLVGTAVARR